MSSDLNEGGWPYSICLDEAKLTGLVDRGESSEPARILRKFITTDSGFEYRNRISMLDELDACLDLREPAYEALEVQVKRPDLIGPASIVIRYIHAGLDISGRVEKVRELVERAEG